MTPPKWLRLSLLVISARSAAGAFALLLCSAVLFFVGYARWGLSWLGNIAATVIVASATTVVIDPALVRYRRARFITTLESGRRQVEKSCDNLIERVNDIREEVDQAHPEPPYWIAYGGYTSAGLDDSWRFYMGKLNDT